MRYQELDDLITSPKLMKLDRMRVLMTWLYEFQFTSYEVAFAVIDTSPNGGYRFLSTLLKQEFLKRFHNEATGDQMHLLCLTLKGVKWLIAHGYIAPESRNHSFKRLTTSTSLIHHLGTQKAVLGLCDMRKGHGYEIGKVSWEQSISVKAGSIRPDAVVSMAIDEQSLQDFHSMFGSRADYRLKQRIAVEFERTDKARKRILFHFTQHCLNLKKGHYSDVQYLFNKPEVMRLYKRVFDEEKWQVYKMGKNGRLAKTMEVMKPNEQVRERFGFSMLSWVKRT